MAGRGPVPKDPERRQRPHRPKALGVVVGGVVEQEVPSAPSGLLKVTRERWAAYWSSPVARLADPVSDLPALERLFALYDDLERSQATVRRQGYMVRGYRDQTVLHPLLKHMNVVTVEVRQLEDRFGLSPRARLSLGVTLGEAARSLADLNSEFMAGGEDDDDPRFDVIEGGNAEAGGTT